jgi:polysaccharide pyruvyl transferase WcaK-like protein
MPDDPVFPIPLTQDQLALIGEICAIQGQIEVLMQEMIHTALRLKPETARKILGSNSIRTNADVWRDILLDGAIDAEFIEVMKRAHKAIATLAKGRNDFIHADYQADAVVTFVNDKGEPIDFQNAEGSTIKFVNSEATAVRVRDRSTRPVKELKMVRDEAARISRMIGHLWALLRGDPVHSPWRGKF